MIIIIILFCYALLLIRMLLANHFTISKENCVVQLLLIYILLSLQLNKFVWADVHFCYQDLRCNLI